MVKISARGAMANFIGALVGIVLAFSLVAAPLFAEGGTIGERMFTFLLAFVIYGLISLGLAILSRTSRAYISLTVPAVLISMSLFSLDGPNQDMERKLLFLIYPTVVLVSAVLPFFLINIFFKRRGSKYGK